MADMKNLIVGNTTYNIIDDEAFRISGDAREGSCLYVGTSSPYTPNLQLKRQNASMLNLSVQDDGYLKLQNVPYVNGQDDWNSATTLWDINMSKLSGFNLSKIREISNLTSSSWSFKAGSANTWVYANKSFTVPASHIYLAMIALGYSTGNPTGMGIHTSNTGTPKYRQEITGLQNSPIWMLSSGTYYVFERRATAPTSNNTNYLNYIDINMG